MYQVLSNVYTVVEFKSSFLPNNPYHDELNDDLFNILSEMVAVPTIINCWPERKKTPGKMGMNHIKYISSATAELEKKFQIRRKCFLMDHFACQYG